MTTEFALNPHDPTPLYTQLYRMLRLRILDGEYAEGEAIPSETVLRDLHGITRSTVRNAVALLVKEGLVQQIRGKGTIVTYSPVSTNIWNFGGFTDYSRALGQRPVTSLLSRSIQDGPQGKILKLVRARGVATDESQTFLHLDTSWLDLQLFPGLEEFDFERLSLYQTMREHYGIVPTRSELTLTVAPPSDLTRQVFGTAHDAPGFICASGTVYDDTDRLVERTSVIYSPALEMKVGTACNRTR